jgi:CheY-like chemotaxis protein
MTDSTYAPEATYRLGETEPLVQTPAGEKVHVLIVDDNDTNRRVLSGMCELFDCATFLAKDGIGAVEAFCTTPFDIILMDIEMPRMGGLEATRLIRSMSELGRRIPIVAVTASVSPSDVSSYHDAGMNAVVAKPIEASRLLEAISTAVGASLASRYRPRLC